MCCLSSIFGPDRHLAHALSVDTEQTGAVQQEWQEMNSQALLEQNQMLQEQLSQVREVRDTGTPACIAAVLLFESGAIASRIGASCNLTL